MSNDIFKNKKDPFNKGNNIYNNRNVVDPTTFKSEETTNTKKIDISLLSDKDRAYYLANGTLPKSEEEVAATEAISNTINQLENEFSVSSTTHEESNKTSIKTESADHQEVIKEIVDTPINESINNELANAMESNISEHITNTNEQTTNVITNWDEETSADHTNESNGTQVSTVHVNETDNIETTNTIPSPSPLNLELPDFAKNYIVKGGDGVIDSVKQQKMKDTENEKHSFPTNVISQEKVDKLLQPISEPIENEKQQNVDTIVNTSQEKLTESSIHQEDKKMSNEEWGNYVEKKIEETDDIFDKSDSNENKTQNVQSSLSNETPEEISISKQEVSTIEKHFDAPVDKPVEEFDSTEEISSEKKSIDYGIVASDVNSTTVYNDLQQYVTNNYNVNTQDGTDKFANDMDDGNSTLYRKNLLSGMSTANRDLDQDAINDKDLNYLANEIPDEIRAKNSKSKIDPNAIKNPNKIVSGKQAAMLINATVRGAKKIFLYNSGFWVLVRPLTNYELSEYINTIRTRNMDYGRELGGHFYLYASLEIKKFFAERIKNIILDCNLQGWKQGNTLIENISLQDFKTILWASACMMFKDGVEFTKICSFCNGTEQVNMNLSKLDFYNFDAIKDSAYPYIMQKKNVTPEDVTEYKNRINYNISPMITVKNFKYIFKVPSIDNYIQFGEMFMNSLVSEVKDIDDIDKINNFVRFAHSKQYVPWIAELQKLDEDNEIMFKIVDGPTIFEVIGETIQDSKEFFDFAEKYIKATMLTYIAFPYIECPHCHKVPTNITNGFVAYDIESAFFTMSVRKSEEVNSQLRV